ncbi:MAG: hypothetical protein FJX67_02155 [Alphaproteobacteria bacterium]|nr:hypothetical protein [Alphaproteobacteria bacterium]
MRIRPEFEHLVALSGLLWAGEAEVARTYFNAKTRTPETDRKWLAHQAYKEYWGSGFVDPTVGLMGEWSREILDKIPALDRDLDRHDMLGLVEQMYAEFHHYCLFADIYDALLPPDGRKLTPAMIKNWPEGEALDNYRIAVRKKHGAFGWKSLHFTEGGYCSLYREGARLKGRGGIDDRIAAACQRVYDDEVEHMLRGMLEMNGDDMTAAEWAALETLVIDQLRLRIKMRNGQFGYPLSDARIEAIYKGDIEPMAFDYGLARAAAE